MDTQISLLTTFVCLFLVDSNKFLGRFFTVSITVSNQFTVFLECLTIFVSHQKHTPESCPRRRSLTPRRCNKPIPSKYSIRLFFKWFRREAVVTAFWTVSISGVGDKFHISCILSVKYPRRPPGTR